VPKIVWIKTMSLGPSNDYVRFGIVGPISTEGTEKRGEGGEERNREKAENSGGISLRRGEGRPRMVRVPTLEGQKRRRAGGVDKKGEGALEGGFRAFFTRETKCKKRQQRGTKLGKKKR